MLFLCFSRMSGDVSAGDGGEPYITPFFPHERGFFLPSEGMENQEKGIHKVHEKRWKK